LGSSQVIAVAKRGLQRHFHTEIEEADLMVSTLTLKYVAIFLFNSPSSLLEVIMVQTGEQDLYVQYSFYLLLLYDYSIKIR
jgi:intracellular septation protein A